MTVTTQDKNKSSTKPVQYLDKVCIVCGEKTLKRYKVKEAQCQTCKGVYPLALLTHKKGKGKQ